MTNDSAPDLAYFSHVVDRLQLLVTTFPLVLALLLVPASIIFTNVIWQTIRPIDPSLPPVVFHWVPFLGSALSYGDDPIKFFIDARDKYGDVFTFILFGRRITVALGSEGNDFVLGGKDTHLSAKEAYMHLTTPIFGRDVVYDVPNDIFMEQKKFVKSGFSQENFRAYVGMIEEEGVGFLHDDSNFDPRKVCSVSEWQSFHAFKAMSELTILTASRTLHGKEVRSSLDKTFAQRYRDLDGGFTPLNFLFPNLPLASYRRRDKAQREMSSFFTNLILKRKLGQTTEVEHDMIATLLQQCYRSGRQMPDHEIAHLLIALLMAGQHTSATTLAWALSHIAHVPSVANALYEEQVKHFGIRDKGEFRTMTYDEMKMLPWLNSVIRETLRLHPPIHSIIRKVKETIRAPELRSTLPKDHGYVIPKGYFVLSSPAVSQIDPSIWRNPLEWNPLRWHESGSYADLAYRSYEGVAGEMADYGFGWICKGTDSPYLPFGAGRHRCIGEQFAYLQIGTIISTFIRKLEMRLDNDIPQQNYHTMITTMKDPCNILFRQRDVA